MKNMTYPMPLMLLLTVSMASAQDASWILSSKDSTLSFISTKNKDIREEHVFKELQGSIDQKGSSNVTVFLDSLETNIEIRNERMREHLFGFDDHPMATVKTQLLPAQLQSGQTDVKLHLEINGQAKAFSGKVTVDRQDNQLIVTSFEPIEVNAKDFAMDDGINQLTSLAQLQSISYIVPVEFKLVFIKKS